MNREGFGHASELVAFDSDWHVHREHQLLYASQGTLHLYTEEAQWLLPPQRGAWISAGVAHRVRVKTSAQLSTVYLRASDLDEMPGCEVFAMPSLGREMLLYSIQWSVEEAPTELSESFFRTLRHLSERWLVAGPVYRLPVPKSEPMQRAVDYALENLAEVTHEDVARVAGVSTRTLSRRFQDEFQMSWRQFLNHARILAAMEMLAGPEARVTETAFHVGYESLSAFTRAFRLVMGMTPSEYRASLG